MHSTSNFTAKRGQIVWATLSRWIDLCIETFFSASRIYANLKPAMLKAGKLHCRLNGQHGPGLASKRPAPDFWRMFFPAQLAPYPRGS